MNSRSTTLRRQKTSAILLAMMLVGCSHSAPQDQVIPTDVRAFMVEEVEHSQVQFIWIKLPRELRIGATTVHVFIARQEPPGSVVPMETELPCILESEDEVLEIRPVPIEFQYDGERLLGQYSWWACASCIDCYMDWETRMEIELTPGEDSLLVSLAIRHMGHNVREDYLRAELPELEPSLKEPRMQCAISGCDPVEFVPTE